MAKKTNLFKAMAFLMAIVMTMGMFSITAFAGVTSASTGKITVSGLDADDKATATVDAYQLITVNTDDTAGQPKDPMFKWVDAVATWLKANGFESFVGTDNEVANSFTKDAYGEANADTVLTGKASELATLYDKLASAIGNNTLTIAPTKTGTGNCELTVPMGNYLVLISGGKNVYRPSTANVIPAFDDATNEWNVQDTTVVVKSTKPQITKTASTTNASIGDAITYTLLADVPTFPANANHQEYYIGDKLGTGLTLNAGTIAINGVKEDGTKDAITATTTTTNATNPKDSSDLSFLLTFDYSAIKAYKQIEVTYTATLNENAVTGYNQAANAGNTNEAYLVYSNKPYGANDFAQANSDEVKVYTYGIDITKVAKDDHNTTLSGAEFTLSNGTELKFTKVQDGVYRLDNAGTDTLTTANGGKLVILGLKAGTYTLKETKAPANYNLPKDTTTIEITAGTDGAVTSNGTNYANGIVLETIENSQGFELPSTGGMGTVIFTVAGIALIALGAGMIVIIKRKNKKTAE